MWFKTRLQDANVPYYWRSAVVPQRGAAVAIEAHPLPAPPFGSVVHVTRFTLPDHPFGDIGAAMIRRVGRLTALAFALMALSGAQSLHAQYFGRNKVQYEKFDWRILKSD